MRLTPYEAIQVLEELDAIVKRADSPLVRLTEWLRGNPDEAIHLYQESVVVRWKELNPLVRDGDKPSD